MNREEGSSLISVMLLIVLIMAMVHVMSIRTVAVARDTTRERGAMQARYAAEAGLAKARVALRADAAWRGVELQVGRCEVVVSVRAVGSGRLSIRSHAVARPGGDRGPRVVCTLERGLD